MQDQNDACPDQQGAAANDGCPAGAEPEDVDYPHGGLEEIGDDGSEEPGGLGEPEDSDNARNCYEDRSVETQNLCGPDPAIDSSLLLAAGAPSLASTLVSGRALIGSGAPASGVSPWGISDQQIATFDDPRFKDLKLGKARLITPWDVIARKNQGGEKTADYNTVVAFMQKVSENGMEPLISFQRTQGTVTIGGGSVRGEDLLPTPEAYADAVRAFRAEFPSVEWYTAWNEPNHGTQPTSLKADRRSRKQGYTAPRPKRTDYAGAREAGRYGTILADQCKNASAPRVKCKVVAGDFSDSGGPGAPTLTRAYLSEYKETTDRTPGIWAIHAYTTARTRDPRAAEGLSEGNGR